MKKYLFELILEIASFVLVVLAVSLIVIFLVVSGIRWIAPYWPHVHDESGPMHMESIGDSEDNLNNNQNDRLDAIEHRLDALDGGAKHYWKCKNIVLQDNSYIQIYPQYDYEVVTTIGGEKPSQKGEYTDCVVIPNPHSKNL